MASDVLRDVGHRHRSLPAVHPAPPFDYPATLEIEYPEQLSRWLVLVKWWLLAIPHYIVIGFFMGGGWFVGDDNGRAAAGFGLIGLVTVFAGVALLFTGALPAWPVRLRDGDEPMGVSRDRLCLADDRPVPAVHLRCRRERAGPASSPNFAECARHRRSGLPDRAATRFGQMTGRRLLR